jgi:hypothetical protein
MRLCPALCLLVSLAADSSAHAQSDIAWSKDRRLARSDFQGRVPSRAVPAALSSLAIQTEWGCEAGELVATASAVFDPSLSWWREGNPGLWSDGNLSNASRAELERQVPASQRERQLLEHEQVHFDIAELMARKLRKRFDELRDACRAPGGTDVVAKAVVDADQDLQKQQARYDSECAYGMNLGAQRRWAERVARELDQSASAAR